MDRSTLLIGLSYFIASSIMLIVNKMVIHNLPVPTIVTTIQYVASSFIVYSLAKCQILKADTYLTLEIVKKYLPIPFLFSLAIFSNMKVLETANVETFMVFRFSTPLLVALVDFAVMGKRLPTLRAWFSFFLIIFGIVVYTLTDDGFYISTLSFHA
jgi:solute carrier family 35 protein